jgi:uncharacterized protein (DUF433 family)
MPRVLRSSLVGLGVYSINDAARLTRIEPRRLRRWFSGYEFKLRGVPTTSERVVTSELPTLNGDFALSFLDLQEARCIAEFRNRGVGWPSLRRAHEQGQKELGTSHPFCSGRFKNIGRVMMYDAGDEEGDNVLLDIARNQRSFRSVLAPLLNGLEFLNDRPVLWYPMARSARVVIDPRRSFGVPIVRSEGVQTKILEQSYRAEGSYRRVSSWYDVDIRDVKDAVRFEESLAA